MKKQKHFGVLLSLVKSLVKKYFSHCKILGNKHSIPHKLTIFALFHHSVCINYKFFVHFSRYLCAKSKLWGYVNFFRTFRAFVKMFNNKSTFGGASTSGFGFNSTPTASPFGQSTFGKPATAGFGQTSAFGQPSSSLFGGNQPAGGLFGATNTSPFGAAQPTTQSGFGGKRVCLFFLFVMPLNANCVTWD